LGVLWSKVKVVQITTQRWKAVCPNCGILVVGTRDHAAMSQPSTSDGTPARLPGILAGLTECC
jgi:hypothetical protein